MSVRLSKFFGNFFKPKVEKRNLQLEIDLYRLFLLTSFQSGDRNVSIDLIERTFQESSLSSSPSSSKSSLSSVSPISSSSLTFDDHKAYVQNNVRSQVIKSIRILKEIVTEHDKNKKIIQSSSSSNQYNNENNIKNNIVKNGEKSKRKNVSGLSFALGNLPPLSPSPPSSPPSPFPPSPFPPSPFPPSPLSNDPNLLHSNAEMESISNALYERLGFTLELKSSTVNHSNAGEGVFIKGKATMGTVVAFYPGIVYPSSFHHLLTKPTRTNLHNPYLLSRYDECIIDGRVWGRGGETRVQWIDLVEQAWSEEEGVGVGEGEGGGGFWLERIQSFNAVLERSINSYGEEKETWKRGLRRKRTGVERRNPLALAHFANHPSPDDKPNVLVCAYDFPLEEEDGLGLREFIPNIEMGALEKGGEGEGRLGPWGKEQEEEGKKRVVRSLVFVSTKDLCDEELLLNYRLNLKSKKPDWYVSVDEEEDRRRWQT